MDTILCMLACVGLSYVIIDSKIFNPIRNILVPKEFLIYPQNYVRRFFKAQLSCYACIGFHCGWFIYLVSNNFSNLSLSAAVIFSLASSAICYTADKVWALMEAIGLHFIGNEEELDEDSTGE